MSFDYRVSFKFEDVQFEKVFSYLKSSYWGKGYEKEIYLKALKNSFVASLFDISGNQVGFARIISDGFLSGNLCDVYVLDEYQGKGLGLYLMEKFIGAEHIKNISRITLSTNDAQDFYAKVGFQSLRFPNNQMERLAKLN